jgi:MarR family transcriptional regulator, organic hydroperoxide resistance regulator
MSSKPIEETLSYTLAQICKAHRTWADEVLAEVGLHVGQEMFLMQLWKQDGQAQSEMASNMCVQPPTVNKMLSRMESAGLVERRTDAEDNRVSRVYLTAEARALQEKVQAAYEQLEERTIANLSLADRDVLKRLLRQVYDNVTSGD